MVEIAEVPRYDDAPGSLAVPMRGFLQDTVGNGILEPRSVDRDPSVGESMASAEDTTELLLTLRGGDRSALDRLMPRVYDTLHRIAHRELARRGGGSTLRTTGLVHEAYLKLVDQSRVEVEDRAHFLALAATAMRHIVIDYARRRGAKKRGGDRRRISLKEAVPTTEDRIDDILDLDAALTRLERFDDRLCKVVECRFFAGLTVEETAAALGISPRTVNRAWQKARAWLYREMHEA